MAKYLTEKGKPDLTHALQSINNQKELDDIKAKAIKNGTFMKAPNGKPTNLNEQQWLQVRTKAFKNWFGDWENDSKNASKVVDENGEPRVMYHGSPNLFDTFSYDFFGDTDPGDNGRGFYFAYRKETAKYYGDNIYPVFLNVKHPFIHIGFDTQNKVKGFNRVYNPTNREMLQKRIDSISRRIELDKEALEEYKEDEFHISILNKRISYNQTSLNSLQQELSTKPKDYLDSKLYDTLDEYDGVMEQDEHYQVVVRNPNQIKSATGNNGMFSTENDDIMMAIESYSDYGLKQAQKEYDNTVKELVDTEKALEFSNSDKSNYQLKLKALHDKYRALYSKRQEKWNKLQEIKDKIRRKEVEESYLPFFKTNNGEVYGFVDKEGNIYLDEDVISPEHPIHEYTHLWDMAVRIKNPELWERGVQLMK